MCLFLSFYIEKATISKIKRKLGLNTMNNVQRFTINFMHSSFQNFKDK